MSSIFQVTGGHLVDIAVRVVNATPVVIADATKGATMVPWFSVQENAGATPSLTVDLYDPTAAAVVAYLGAGGVSWKAKALTALQSVVFDAGYVVRFGLQLRVTSSDAAGKIDVVGTKIGRT